MYQTLKFFDFGLSEMEKVELSGCAVTALRLLRPTWMRRLAWGLVFLETIVIDLFTPMDRS